MPVSPIRRHRPAAVLAAVVLGLGLLAGCAGQRAPGDYSDKVERNFVRGCTAAGDDAPESFDVQQYCQCSYDAMSAERGGVDFDTFKSVNDDLVEEAGPLPSSITKVLEDCRAEQTGDAGGSSDGGGAQQDGTTTTTEG